MPRKDDSKMAEQPGKLEKPGAQHFTSKRKLYFVPQIFSGEEAPFEYVEKFNLYWEQRIKSEAICS